MGAKDSDVWQIKKWTDAWIKGGTIGLDEEGVVWATEMEIQAQHYFQAIFELSLIHISEPTRPY